MIALVSCGSGAPASCPSDLPSACPSTVPSYTRDVAPAIQSACVRCHSAGGVAGNRPLTSYPEVASQKSQVLTQIYGCRMPPPGEPALTASQRKAILGWLVCQAPEN